MRKYPIVEIEDVSEPFCGMCPKGPDHEWMATPANRTTRGSGCPMCVGKQISITNCLATLSPETAQFWHPTKNGKLSPRDVTPNSTKVVWWICSDGHSWQQSIFGRAASPIYCWQCLGKTSPGVPTKLVGSRRRNGKVRVTTIP